MEFRFAAASACLGFSGVLAASGFDSGLDSGARPFYSVNHSPLVGVYGLPGTESAILLGEGETSGALLVDVASHNITEDDAGIGSETLQVDGETLRTTMVFRYGLSESWQLGLDIPYVRHSGGSLDGFIEDWHRTFGLPQGGRDKQPSNRLRIRYTDKGVERVLLAKPASGLGDIQLKAAWQIHQKSGSQSVLQLSVKLPTGKAKDLTGSGGTDVSAGVAWSNTGWLSDWQVQLDASGGILLPGKGDLLRGQQESVVGYGSVGASWQAWPSVALQTQVDVHSGFYDSSLDELSGVAARLFLGGTVRLADNWSLVADVSEDLTVNRASDVVLQLGIRYQ